MGEARERWLRERAESAVGTEDSRNLVTVSSRVEKLRTQYASEVARIDAAEARFEACSEEARRVAGWIVPMQPNEYWKQFPSVIEAIADVAERIDRRANNDK